MSYRIAIIGAGFCGTVLAANLLRRPRVGALNVVLVERGPEFGRGVAYAVTEHEHLLNVPAGRLSADSQQPEQFLQFARRSRPHTDAEDFLPRDLYGTYLQEVLAHAEAAAPAGVTLTRLHDEAVRVTQRSADTLTIEFANHAAIDADRVVLASGNPPPPVLPWAMPVRDHPAYREDPWAELPRLAPDHTALIVGSGLTMVDIALSLSRNEARTPQLVSISRRGLVPLPQSAFHAHAMRGDAALLEGAQSIRGLFKTTRRWVRDVEAHGGDWREVVTFVRNYVPGIWQRLPDRERRRFVRHVQGHWDVHRHRVPAALAQRIAALRTAGRLVVNAGRIEAIEPEGERLKVTWRRRGADAVESFTVDTVINAMGPDYNVSRATNALFKTLCTEGWLQGDPLGLGVLTNADGACVGADGKSNERLYYLGPMLRAMHWEATAVTELRNHAERLATHLGTVNCG